MVGAGENDYSQRDLRWSTACFAPLTQDREFAQHNKDLMAGWMATWVPRCLEAARTLQPVWSQAGDASSGMLVGATLCAEHSASARTWRSIVDRLIA